MKLIQKSLLFASLLGVGASVTSVATPILANGGIVVQAATTTADKTIKVCVSKAQLYNSKGNKLSRCLKKNETCKDAVKKTIKGKEYYKIGSKDEYVKVSDVKVVK